MAAGYIPVPRVYLKYIPVVSFDVRYQSGIYVASYTYITLDEYVFYVNCIDGHV